MSAPPILTSARILLTSVLAVLVLSTHQQQQEQEQGVEKCQSRNDTEVLAMIARDIPGAQYSSWNIRWSGKEVVGLNLSGMNLSGALNPAWGQLPALTSMDISSNNFSGPLQVTSCNISGSSLQFLNLSNNRFTGSIPQEISKMGKLETLDLSSNFFSGELPQISLPSLRVLNLSSNNLSGNTPALGFGSPKLEILDASQNGFEGGVPDRLMELRELKVLNLSTNNFTGAIPGAIRRLGNLTRLVLSFNQLTGAIPDALGDCLELRYIEVTRNNLTGGIPSSLGKLPKLSTLNAGQNRLSSFDVEAGTFQKLEALYLPKNRIQGPIPVNLANMTSLKKLFLQENQLSGPIPADLHKCSLLEEIWLNANYLTGPIPEQIFGLGNLIYLSLGSNRLSGSLPAGVLNCTKLANLWVEQNYLTGNLPDNIGSLKGILVLSVSGNGLTGGIPNSFGNLTTLIGIDLGSNKFSGELPQSFRQLGRLEFLFVSNNSFSGYIPDWIGQLPKLRALDLSNNNFSGTIPSNFSGVKTLRTRKPFNASSPSAQVHTPDGREYQGFAFPTTIDLSHNKLSGTIPVGLGDLGNLQGLILSYNNLTGNIPRELGSASYLLKVDLSHNNLIGSIPQTFTELTFLQNFDVSYNQLSGRIPQDGQFNTFQNTSFEGNQGLCGRPLSNSNCSQAGPDVVQAPRGRQSTRKVFLPVIMTICGAVFFSGVLAMYFALARKRQKLYGEGCEMMGGTSVYSTSGTTTTGGGRRGRGSVSFTMAFSDKLPPKIGAEHLAAATNNYSQANIVGDGGFGIVYRAVLESSLVVAVKKLSSGGVQGDREFQAELQTLGNLRHDNLVPLLGYCEGSERLLIYKYLPNGSLDTWLYCRDAGVSPLDWPTRLRIARGAAAGVAYLHGERDHAPIIHRDIKVSNILLDERFEAHVADFGLARHVDAGSTHVSTDVAGTIGYIPPEYNHKCVATTKGDVYSFGVVCLEMLTGKRPTDQYFRRQAALPSGAQHLVAWVRAMRTLDEHRAALDPSMMSGGDWSVEDMLEMIRIACMCCREAPSKRPSMQEVAELLQRLEQRVIAGQRNQKDRCSTDVCT